MIHSTPCKQYVLHSTFVQTLEEKVLILHADHEQNSSTFTVIVIYNEV